MGLKDKASKINFGALAGAPAASIGDTKAAKTAPGELMAFANQQRSQLLQENEELKSKAAHADDLRRHLDEALSDLKQWDGAKAARLLDPNKVRRSKWANRHELNFDGESFEQLRTEIRSAGGNVQPIKVRAILGTDEYEIVFGHRRNEACRLEAVPVLALIDNLDDRALFIEMDRENRSRKDLSPWEQGVMYRQALDSKLFPNQKSLALDTGADQSLLTKALYLADLPTEVVEAFPSIFDLQFRFAKPLRDAIERDKAHVIKVAKQILKEQPRPDAKATLERLISRQDQKMEPFHFPDPITFERNGKKVGALTIDTKGVSMNLAPDILSVDEVKRIEDLVRQALIAEKS